jgi:phasin family protein
MITADQIAATNKANLDTFLDLTNKAFAGVEKLVELNMAAARATLSESADTAKTLLAAKDPQELINLQTALVQPSAEKALSYGRQVYDITVAAQADVTKLAETQLADAQEKLNALVDTAVKNAPAGSESAVAMVKSAVAAANNAFESVQKATKQAVSTAEANIQAMTQQATKAATAAAPKAAKKAA